MSAYRPADPVTDECVKALETYDELTRTLLFNRGITTASEAEAFLNPDYDTHRHDPFLLPDMERAVVRIVRAIEQKEQIVIYSDYDCDGIPGGVLLHDFFTAIGCTNFKNYIPHRHEEGYGLSSDALKKLIDDGAELIITVDCGITDVEPVAYAQERGVDVIVTDHHLPAQAGESGETLPPAHAVINPKREGHEYPFRELCGSGVAFKLVEALLSRLDHDLKPGFEKWWLDVVGLATIADMVPLTGENRVFAHYGLLVLRKARRLGLQHLLRKMRINPRHLTEDDIGFMIAPRINAASRMDNPEDAFNMLTARTEEDAGMYAKHLDRINNERKGVVAAMVKDIKGRIKKTSKMQDVLVMGNPMWRPSLVGLAANTLAEEYDRPVFIWGRDGRDVIKGSCRSDGRTSVVTLMQEAREVFVEYGGHHASGGFSVNSEHVHTFADALNEAYERIGASGAVDGQEEDYIIDADLSVEDVTNATYKKINALAPFGMGNQKPLFRFLGVVPETVTTFGKKNEHIKAVFRKKDGTTVEAVGFFMTAEGFAKPLTENTEITLIANIEYSYFMNRPQLRLRIVDVV